VGWAKFAPQGRRGCDAANPDAPYLTMPVDEYVAEANRQTFVIVQIESPEALEKAGEIAAVDGVDLLLLGPGDFSILSGFPGRMDHERIREAKLKVAEAARLAGKDWGCPVGSVQQAAELMEMGARLICYQADIVMIKSGLEQIQREMAPLGFTFDRRVG
jgi:2-keto-3-deoxy-L-rhamnonate aldolase RhmA